MGNTISAYMHGSLSNTANQAQQNGHNAASTSRSNNNRRLRNRIRRGRRAGHARSSGLFSIDAESGLQKVENPFRYPPVDVNGPYLGNAFLLGAEKYDRPTLAPPLSDTTYAFGDNYDLNFLAGKSNTVNLPSTIQDLSEPTVPLRALINIRRDSLRLTKCKLPPDNHASSSSCYNLEFVFDSLVRCYITVYYICQESFNDADGMRFIPHPQSAKFTSPQYTHTAGAAQLFCHPDHVLDTTEMKIFSTFADKQKLAAATTGRTTASNASKRSNSNNTSAADTESGETVPGGGVSVEMAEANCIDTTHYLPMVVHCVALEETSDGIYAARQSHATLLFLERASDSSNEFVLKYVKQKVWIGGASFLLQEVFGIENKHAGLLTTTPSIARGLSAGVDDGSDGGNDAADDSDDDDVDEDEDEAGNDCAICMSEPRDTMILPCRHLCICSQCAESLRYQANNCPICRAPFKYLVQLRAYLRQTALEQQQQAELLAHQREQDERENEPKSTGNPASVNVSVVVAVPTPTNVTAVVNERQSSLVPGDSDADDEPVGVDLGKKKSRDRIEPPGFAGLTSCALIDTLNGTRQAYDALRNEAAEQLKQRQRADDVEHGARVNLRVPYGKASTKLQTERHLDLNDDAGVEPEYSDFNSETDENEEEVANSASAAQEVADMHAVVHDADNLSRTAPSVVETPDEVDRRLETALNQKPRLNDYDSSADDDEGDDADDHTQTTTVEHRQPAVASPRQSTVRSARSSSAGTGGTAALRSGSGHSNDVLLVAGHHHDGAETAKSPRKY